jgi:hypothetical protein
MSLAARGLSGDDGVWDNTNGFTFHQVKPSLFNNRIGFGTNYEKNAAPTAEARYRARFTFDPNSISIGYSGTHDIFVGRSARDAVCKILKELTMSPAA